MMDNRENEREWEELVDTIKTDHNSPPETPRDRMWERIEAQRAERAEKRPTRGIIAGVITPRVWRLAAAAAAVLVLGIGIGRMTRQPLDLPPNLPQSVAQVQAPVPEAVNNDLLYRKATADLFGRADALLTDFKVSGCSGQGLETAPDWAGGMLLQTRMIMGTPIAQDPKMGSLLLDLELVLAQIVGISKDNCARDVVWIRDALAEKSTINRLRLMRPADAVGEAL